MTQTIHAVLQPGVWQDSVRRAEFRETLMCLYHIQNFNESRYQRFGIVSGEIDSSLLSQLRCESSLKSVSVDELKYAV